jgi:hypothetical protein
MKQLLRQKRDRPRAASVLETSKLVNDELDDVLELTESEILPA